MAKVLEISSKYLYGAKIDSNRYVENIEGKNCVNNLDTLPLASRMKLVVGKGFTGENTNLRYFRLSTNAPTLQDNYSPLLGDFTIMGWMSKGGVSTYHFLWYGFTPTLQIRNESNGKARFYLNSTTPIDITSVKIYPNTSYNHYCVIRKNGTFYFIVNGILIGSVTQSVSLSFSTYAYLMSYVNYPTNGYADNLQYYKGEAIYNPTGYSVGERVFHPKLRAANSKLPYIFNPYNKGIWVSSNHYKQGVIDNITLEITSLYDYKKRINWTASSNKPTLISGANGKGFYLTGGNGEYLKVPTSIEAISLNHKWLKSFCIMGWWKYDSITTVDSFPALIYGNIRILFRTVNGNCYFWHRFATENGNEDVTSGIIPELNTTNWIHVTVIGDGTGNIYSLINGVVKHIGSITGTPNGDNSIFYLGLSGVQGVSIDDFFFNQQETIYDNIVGASVDDKIFSPPQRTGGQSQ